MSESDEFAINLSEVNMILIVRI